MFIDWDFLPNLEGNVIWQFYELLIVLPIPELLASLLYEVKDKTLMIYLFEYLREPNEKKCLLSVQCYSGGQVYLWVFRFQFLQKHDRCHCGCFKHLKSGQKRHLRTTLPPPRVCKGSNLRFKKVTCCFYFSSAEFQKTNSKAMSANLYFNCFG